MKNLVVENQVEEMGENLVQSLEVEREERKSLEQNLVESPLAKALDLGAHQATDLRMEENLEVEMKVDLLEVVEGPSKVPWANLNQSHPKNQNQLKSPLREEETGER